GYLVHRQDEVKEGWLGFIKPFLVLGPMAFLLIMEPDFGATVVLMGAAVGMMFLGGVALLRFTRLLGSLAGLPPLLVSSEPSRVRRPTRLLIPWQATSAAGYPRTQPLIACGRGGWLGVGLGTSVRRRFYLPEAHSAFVFSVLAEE